MKGVEIIKGRETSEETYQKVKLFIESLDKIPSLAVDYAGFITSRLLNVYLNEAALAVMDGNSPEEIDRAMVTCTNMPMGPCKLLDLVGIDVAVYVLKVLEDEFGERFKCAPLLKQMVRAGHLGVKTGKGFYNYTDKKN
jgi:3-hydroxybutyryl-CoA dehydrogenase